MKKEEKPRAAEAILKNTNVDDICDSVNIKVAKALMSDIHGVLNVGSFHVKLWISSTQSHVKENPSEVTIGGESLVEKVLGTVWLPQEDMFTFTIKLELAKENLPSGDPGTFIPLKLKKTFNSEQASRCIRSNGSWSSSPCEAEDCNAGTMVNWPWLG